MHSEQDVAARRGRLPVALALVAALAVVAALALKFLVFGGSGCSGGVTLRVAATPEIAPALREINNAWQDQHPNVGGTCVNVTIDATATPVIASRLTVLAGNGIDVAAAPEPTPDEDQLPAVWIPDSTAWLRRVQQVDRAAFADDARSIASTPVVAAMPADVASAVGATVRLDAVPGLMASGSFTLAMAEPRRETASLAAAALLGAAVAPTEAQLPALVRTFRGIVKTAATADMLPALGSQASAGPAAEQAIYAYNSTNPRNRLVAVPFQPPGPRLDYPYAIRSALSRDVAQAAQLFRAAVLAAPEVFARHAFRTVDGEAGSGFPGAPPPPAAGPAFDDAATIERTLALWSAASSPSRTLALLDVTSSMNNALGGRSRSDVMIAAAQGGLELFTPDSLVGLWAFGAGHQEVLPIGALSPGRRAEIGQRMAGAQPSASNRAELYDTLLAAYQLMREGYDPARPNLIVVLTDGADSDPTPLRQEQFKQAVQKLADPTRPIRVVLIGVGASATDAAGLQEIAAVMGGGYFPLTSPDQIQSIFLRALLRLT